MGYTRTSGFPKLPGDADGQPQWRAAVRERALLTATVTLRDQGSGDPKREALICPTTPPMGDLGRAPSLIRGWPAADQSESPGDSSPPHVLPACRLAPAFSPGNCREEAAKAEIDLSSLREPPIGQRKSPGGTRTREAGNLAGGRVGAPPPQVAWQRMGTRSGQHVRAGPQAGRWTRAVRVRAPPLRPR